MIVNLNQKVKVEFTEKGRAILFDHYAEWPGVAEEKFKEKEFQLWELMNIFGQHLYNGCSIPFVNNIIDIDEKL